MSRFVHPDLEDVSLSAVLHALSDPVRRAILRSLASDLSCHGKGKPCAAAAPPDVPKATLSNHYAVLRAAGLVRAEKKGVEVLHRIRCDEVDQRFPGVLSAVLESDKNEAAR
jgi:DNA-binding transcriptional ArsR family regulator